VATGVLVVVAVGLRFGVPIYRQQVAIREIQRFYGTVETRPRGPKWLRERVGDEEMKLFDDVVGVDLSIRPATDATIGHVGRFASLQDLSLGNTQVTEAGLAHLKGLTGLKLLSLSNTQVTDAGLAHLKGLTRLEHLYLENTRVSDAGLEHLKGLTRLKDLLLNGADVTDGGLVHLEGLSNLRWLSLGGTQVTDAGIATLEHFPLEIGRPVMAAPAAGDACRLVRKSPSNRQHRPGRDPLSSRRNA
jgi:internalin A